MNNAEKLLINNRVAYTIEETDFQNLFKKAFKILTLKEEEYSLVLVDEKAMQHINKIYRGKDAPTDVLAFDYGEILLCPEYIKKKYEINKKKDVYTKMQELFVHGLVHIAGFHHNSDEQAKKSKQLEEKILA